MCVLHVYSTAGSRAVLTLPWLKDGLLCSADPQGPGRLGSSTPGGRDEERVHGLAIDALTLNPGGGGGGGRALLATAFHGSLCKKVTCLDTCLIGEPLRFHGSQGGSAVTALSHRMDMSCRKFE